MEELNYFKKYSIEIKMFSDKELIIPEYKIDLINKSKKIINSFENINSLDVINKNNKDLRKNKNRSH